MTLDDLKDHINSDPSVAAVTGAVYWDSDKEAAVVEPIYGFTSVVRDHVATRFRIRSCVEAMQVIVDRPCRHRRTTYNEQDGSLFCEVCQSWVVDDTER